MPSNFQALLDEQKKKSAQKPVENRGGVYMDKDGKLQFPMQQKPYIDPNLKISAPTGKEISISELPKKEREKAQAEIRESEIQASGKGGFAEFVKGLARAPFRAAQATAMDYMSPDKSKGGEVFTPQTSFEKLIFGEAPIKSVATQYGEAKKTLDAGGYGGASSPIALTAIAGSTIFDLFPFNGSKKELSEQLARTITREGVEAILKKANVADDVIIRYADDFVKATTSKQTQAILKEIEVAEKTFYHGTQAAKFDEFEGITYLTKDPDEAKGFAQGSHLGGGKGGEARVLNVSAEFKKVKDIDDKVMQALEDGNLDEVIAAEVKAAKKSGHDAVSFTHPSNYKEGDFIAYVPVENSKVKVGDVFKTVEPKSPGPLPGMAERELKQGLPSSRIARQAQKAPQKDFSKTASYLNDTIELKNGKGINTAHLNISDEAKSLIDEEFKGLGDRMSEKVGRVLKNSEVQEFADESSKVLQLAATRADTLKWEAGLLKLRERLAASAQSGQVTKEFIEDLAQVKQIGSDIGRKLQSFAIGADPKTITSKQFILEEVLKITDNADEIIKAAQGVNFNNVKEASAFYRQFIKPTISEWVDLLRYNSMLSSPLTHAVNIFSNIGNTLVAQPLTKLVAGGLDLLSSAATGKARTQFAGEAGSYIAGYLKSFKDATNRFAGVWSGAREFTNLDLRQIPLATQGATKRVEQFLSVPLKLLEGADQFFTALAEGGETAALNLRQAKGVAVKNVAEAATEGARYSVFRQGLFKEGQGTVLDALDVFTSKILSLRKNNNPIISTVAKFTVPFVSTPMNIFKQGIEYSPVGFLTAFKNTKKTEQFAKAIIGTGVAIGAGTLIASNRMTWAEPTNADERNGWRENGMQPYSVKLGDRWYSYQKLPPFLSFPLSMTALVHDAIKSKKMTDSTGELVLTSFAKYAEFLADQSYFKSIGDFFDALTGDEYAISRLIGNYPQQLVPYRAFGGWLSRLTDGVQRQVDNQAGFIDKQVQLLMMNVPYFSQYVPERIGPSGKPIENRDRLINAVSPVRTISQSDEEARRAGAIDELKRIKSNATEKSNLIKEKAVALEVELSALPKEEANARASKIKQEDPVLYEKLKDVIEEKKLGLTFEEKKMKALGVENGDRAHYILSQIEKLETAEQKNAYVEELKRKKIMSDAVVKQIRALKK